MSLVPKIVLTTGCSSGIGLATAVLLGSRPNKYKVYATMRDPSKAGDLMKAAKSLGAEVTVLPLDVSKEDSIDRCTKEIFAKEGRIDVLINNAGFTFAKPLEFTSMSEFHEIFDTNLFGVVAMCKAVVPGMRERKSGHILNISSFGGLIGQPFNDAYCAAKFAVVGLTESMYTTLPPLGVKVTLVCPGAVTTPFVAKATSNMLQSDDNNPYSGLQNAYMGSMKAIFAGAAASGIKSSQTPEEIAGVLMSILETEKPKPMYLTSEYISKSACLKLKDPTGETVAKESIKRSFGDYVNVDDL